MPKPTTAAERNRAGLPGIRVVIVTMDSHLVSAVQRARSQLARRLPGLTLTIHAASEWGDSPDQLQACVDDIGRADLVIATMLFMEEHFHPVLAALKARREHCDAMVCALCAAEVMRLTRMGRFTMDRGMSGPLALLRKLRGKSNASGERTPKSAGAQQMRMLRRLPQILRFIPGTAQDVRAYFLCLQYWLAGSQENIANLVHYLVDRYADGPRYGYRGLAKPEAPVEYPDVGLYHPRMAERFSESVSALPKVATTGQRGRVGLLLMRSYLLAGNTAHYDGVIAALEARGLQVVPAFASGLDARPAIEAFFHPQGKVPAIDALVSLTGFSLIGGPAYNDAKTAEEVLSALDVPYLAVTPVEFQSLEQWGASERGLLPVESTMMVAIPELDGSTGSMVYGGRPEGAGRKCTGCERACSFSGAELDHDMQVCTERADALAARVARLVDLRRSERADRRLAAVIFNFPPNAGNTGTAAYLSVFESLFNTLKALDQAGYTVELPASVDALRDRIIEGNAARYGASANVHALIASDDHVRRERWLKDIEAQWGPAPGRQQTNGSAIFVLGERFGNVFVGIQPGFGYEGDPMRLLFERGFAPTHAFSAFYRWIREDFAAHAVLHFGTHGALEFMPGKQTGLTAACWPDRLIGDLPNFYLYAANNPSEGAIAKRRAAATLISYLTPPVTQAGLYRELIDLKASLDRWRSLDGEHRAERDSLATLIQSQAALLELVPSEPAWTAVQHAEIDGLADRVLELEYTLIPHGLHVVGRVPSLLERNELLIAHAQGQVAGIAPARWPDLIAGLRNDTGRTELRQALIQDGAAPAETAERLVADLLRMDGLLQGNHEIEGVIHALDGRFVRPAPGGDLLRSADVLPTGRNLHGFDPFRLPSAFAVQDGASQAERLLQRHLADGHGFPESVAMVLWGTDNLKTEGSPIAQALALMGATPRFDGYGRLAGASLIPLETLGRPRIDVMITLSGIFRDLLPLQVRMLAEAAWLAASADEPTERNFIRKHALAYQAEHGGDLETAALRVFGNAEGAYGANINLLIDSSAWDGEDELAEAYTRRKGFAYGRNGRPVKQPALLDSVLSKVELAYQNLDSIELGVTTIDTYFDTLGGVSRAVRRAKRSAGVQDSEAAPVYIGDQTRGDGAVRTLSEQVALETRTRMLNPKWYEGMLEHGYEGVRQIELHITNTMGWSATTGQVQPWVYQQLTQTFMLDPEMRERLARLNPTASAKVANRLLEASERQYWKPEAHVLEALRRAGEELEDRIEGVFEGSTA
ncbi:MAG TPA: magnesium chelatase subunit H [Burkholderiaceae bacterium]|nr:magnesium chelatase subunit H [Burkholderiaceae bacterium]